MPSFPTTLLTALVAVSLSITAQANYTLVDSFQGSTFFDSFSFFEEADPTHGFVDYVDFDTAVSKQLIGVVNTTDGGPPATYIGADFEDVTTTGRPSVRIQSNQSWQYGLLIVDIASMPSGPSLWPSIWTLPNSKEDVQWPQNGEIDILESVNGQPFNSMTLHTTAGCSLTNSSTSSFSGQMTTSNCDVNAPGQSKNAGCQIVAPTNDSVTLHGKSRSYATGGEDFNKQGGGVYAMLWESDGLTFWFFPPGTVPQDIASETPDPSTWSQKPVARFEGCQFQNYLKEMSLIINLTFCGDWAGAVWSSDGSAAKTGTSDCNTYVGQKPEAFKDAYWLINSIKMYQEGSNSTVAHSKRDTGVSKRSHLIPEIDLRERSA